MVLSLTAGLGMQRVRAFIVRVARMRSNAGGPALADVRAARVVAVMAAAAAGLRAAIGSMA